MARTRRGEWQEPERENGKSQKGRMARARKGEWQEPERKRIEIGRENGRADRDLSKGV